jgi:hypothetical protein
VYQPPPTGLVPPFLPTLLPTSEDAGFRAAIMVRNASSVVLSRHGEESADRVGHFQRAIQRQEVTAGKDDEFRREQLRERATHRLDVEVRVARAP